MKQPDLHYHGPLSLDYLDALGNKIQAAIDTLPEIVAEGVGDQFAWEMCRQNWLDTLAHARRKLSRVYASRLGGVPMSEADSRKVVDICLCILRDLEVAKTKGFVE